MKLNCKSCELEVTPYVTPYESNWKAECSSCGEFIKIFPDTQPDDGYLVWALARREPRTEEERKLKSELSLQKLTWKSYGSKEKTSSVDNS